MRKMKLHYSEKDDVIHLLLSDESEAKSVELSPNITTARPNAALFQPDRLYPAGELPPSLSNNSCL